MEIERLSMESGALRFAIDGAWTCADLSSFLEKTDDVYRRLNSIFVLRGAIDAEARRNREYEERKEYDRRDFSWYHEFFGAFHDHPMGIVVAQPSNYLHLIDLTSAVSEPLLIDAISYASPGWVQMIGSWNPLKVLADFISK